MGNPVGSDVSFVFNRQSRLMAHKVFCCLFSHRFKGELDKNKRFDYLNSGSYFRLKYIEITSSNVKVEYFIDFLKLLYNGFDHMGFDPKMKAEGRLYTLKIHQTFVGLLACALEYKEHLLIKMMSMCQTFSENNVAQVYLYVLSPDSTNPLRQAKRKKIVALMESAISYIEEQFESIVRDEDLLKEWDESLMSIFAKKLNGKKKSHTRCITITGPMDDWCGFANWLDILWFAHHTKDAELRKTAAQSLRTLINVENVVGIITGAHTAGEKEVGIS